jgi:hypothetical protein
MTMALSSLMQGEKTTLTNKPPDIGPGVCSSGGLFGANCLSFTANCINTIVIQCRVSECIASLWLRRGSRWVRSVRFVARLSFCDVMVCDEPSSRLILPCRVVNHWQWEIMRRTLGRDVIANRVCALNSRHHWNQTVWTQAPFLCCTMVFSFSTTSPISYIHPLHVKCQATMFRVRLRSDQQIDGSRTLHDGKIAPKKPWPDQFYPAI